MDHTFVNRELSLFSYEILGLVGPNGAGAHDLLRMARHGRILDWAGESQYYVEPKRLAKLGYLSARTEPGICAPNVSHEKGSASTAAVSGSESIGPVPMHFAIWIEYCPTAVRSGVPSWCAA